MARNEAEMISKAPIKIKLGDKDYQIPVLTILPSREWRLKLNEALKPILETFQFDGHPDSESMGHSLTVSLIQFPEKMADLIFDYAGDALSKDEVLAIATEEQIGTAFSRIMEVAYPLVPLKMALKAAQITSPPATAKYTN